MKILKNRLFIFILGGIFFSSIAVFAVTTISADKITYTDKNNVERTVDVVLDDLYTKQNEKTASDYFPLRGGQNFFIGLSNVESKFKYFNIKLTGSSSNATCRISTYANYGTTKLTDLSFENDYETKGEGVPGDYRIKFESTTDWCTFLITYHN